MKTTNKKKNARAHFMVPACPNCGHKSYGSHKAPSSVQERAEGKAEIFTCSK